MSPHCVPSLALPIKTGLAYTRLNVSGASFFVLLKGLSMHAVLVPRSLVVIIHTIFISPLSPSLPPPLSLIQDAITAVFQDCDYPSLSRNKNLENFKRRCELSSYCTLYHATYLSPQHSILPRALPLCTTCVLCDNHAVWTCCQFHRCLHVYGTRIMSILSPILQHSDVHFAVTG